MAQDAPPHRQQKAALIVGFLAFTAAIAIAHRTPATGYELSIYRSTPAGYWIATAVAALVGLWIASTASGRTRDGAHLLVAGAVLSVLGLPALRSYEFYGAGDSLTHLGWATDMNAGVLSPFDNLYPALHLLANFVHELAGVGLGRALVVLPVVVFPLVFVIFVTLSVSVVSTGRWAATVGLLSALLVLPLNLVSSHPLAHPSSQSILFVPLVLYLLFRYVEAPAGLGAFTTPSGAAVGIVAVAMVFFHPQETMNLLALLVAVAVVQFLVRRYRPEHPIAEHRPTYGHVLLVGVAFFGWTFQHERARARLAYAVGNLVSSGASTLEQTDGRVASLQALGGSVEEVALKLFAVTVVFGLLAALLVAATATGKLRDSPTANQTLVTYLGAALVPLGALFAFVFVADQGDHYFRFLGFMLVPITILGAVALSMGIEHVSYDVDRRTIAVVVVLCFALLIPVQAMVFHHSPYMYQSNQQITEGAMEGHENAFEYRDDEVTMMGLRGGPKRFVDAIYGSQTARESLEFAGYEAGMSGEVFSTNMTSAYEDDRYLTTIEADYEREIDLYRGLRFNESGFRTLEEDPAVGRVQSNGDFEMYVIDGSGA